MDMKKINLLFCALIVLHANAQKPNWQNLDLQKDSVFGISTEKAYAEILSQKKKYRDVIVGVIDSGVDTAHEDLKAVIWTNPKKDKDYPGDLHGWDFIGGPHGDIEKENLEMTRLIRAGKADSSILAAYDAKRRDDLKRIEDVSALEKNLDSMVYKMKKDTPTLQDFKFYHPINSEERQMRMRMISILQHDPDYFAYRSGRLKGYHDHFQEELDFYMNPEFNPRPSIVGDDNTNAFEHFYGNPDVYGPAALHGTHVSGIIGAVRDNGIGIQGIANHVWIMSIRTVPDGDERDKDVANAICFAADHRVRVVNMSFGKNYSPDKKAVDEAVRYAMSKDVLLIQAAGNDGKNIDHEPNYPNRIYQDGTTADAYLVVGASNWNNDSTLIANFSNWGKTSVDVFAPGVDIYSSIPRSKYTNESGTSMAAPVVTGLAALIREYYPKLTAIEVKQIIIQSVVKPAYNIQVIDGTEKRSVPMSEICVSGGVVNVYQALQLAAHFK
jgi:subtilisin family serine protease